MSQHGVLSLTHAQAFRPRLAVKRQPTRQADKSKGELLANRLRYLKGVAPFSASCGRLSFEAIIHQWLVSRISSGLTNTDQARLRAGSG